MGGGLCVVRGEHLVLIDQRAPLIDRLRPRAGPGRSGERGRLHGPGGPRAGRPVAPREAPDRQGDRGAPGSRARRGSSKRTDPIERQARSRYVLCVKNRGYAASLERRKIYRRLNDIRASRHGLIRVVDESGQDYLYPSSYFVSIAVPKPARRALSHAR
jgi:hypothetical protein